MKYAPLTSKLFVSVMAISSLISCFAFADDERVRAGFEEAKALFAQRSGSNLAPIERAIFKLKQLENKADDSDLNYDVFILESRALYFKGQHLDSNEERIAIHAQGQAKADEAKKVNDAYADAYYYAGINLARWGEANGVLTSISRKGELVNYMNETMNHMTKDDNAGESIDGYGPMRVLGRLYHKLPSIFGGSHTEAVKHLKKAVAEAKDLALNVVYFAEALEAGDSSERREARALLDEMLSKDPQTYNPSRVPETVEEFELARKLRAGMR